MAMRMNTGKFDNALDEAMYGISLEGAVTAEAGSSTESPGTWGGCIEDGEELAKLLSSSRGDFPNVSQTDIDFLSGKGAAGVIITENSDGFVKVAYYKDLGDLRKDWAELEEQLSVGDDDELEPNASRAGNVESLARMSLPQLRRHQALTVKQIEAAHRQGNTRALTELQAREKEIDQAIMRVAFKKNGRLDRDKIQKALTLVHHYEKSEPRPQAARRAILNTKLSGEEARVLLTAIHVEQRELSPNTSIADRRKAGIIEGLTKAEMDSMEIQIPDWGDTWKQIGGGMDPGAHGGTIATANGRTIELIKIQPTREYVGDKEAADVGYPFWSREGYYDLDDLSLDKEDVQSAIEYTGLGEHLLELTPEQRAVAIAEAMVDAGARADEGQAGWAKDVIGDRIVEWMSGKTAGYEYIADEDDEFRREILGERYEVVVDGAHESWFSEDDGEDDAIEHAETLSGHVQVKDSFDGEVLWDSNESDDEDDEHTPNRSHRRNARWPTLMQGNDPMSGLLDMAAESIDPSGRGDVPDEVSGELSYTDRLVKVVFEYEDALRQALEEVVRRYPPKDDATAEELFDDDAPYLVLMTLRGEGVGIWDGRWDAHYDSATVDKVGKLLKEKLGKYADNSGSGRINDALDDAVYQAMRRAGYGTNDEGYVKLGEGEEVDFEFEDKELSPERVEEIVRANDIDLSRFWQAATDGRRKPITRGEVDHVVSKLGGKFAKNSSATARWHVFLNGELLDPVYMDASYTKDEVKRYLVKAGYDQHITVEQPPERRTNLPPHYRSGREMRSNRKWTRAYMDDLPDSAFLYVESGGRKDGSGKTVPRTLRHFPVRNAEGSVDVNHLRNALARIPQSKLSERVKSEARAKAERLLEQYR